MGDPPDSPRSPRSGKKKARTFSSRCWLARHYPISLAHVIPLLEVVAAGNKHFAQVREDWEQEAVDWHEHCSWAGHGRRRGGHGGMPCFMAAALCRVPSNALRLQAATYLRQFENSEETFPVKVQVRPGAGLVLHVSWTAGQAAEIAGGMPGMPASSSPPAAPVAASSYWSTWLQIHELFALAC